MPLRGGQPQPRLFHADALGLECAVVVQVNAIAARNKIDGKGAGVAVDRLRV